MVRNKFRVFITISLGLAGISFLYPLLWMVLLSMKTTSDIFNNPFGLPKEWRFANYFDAITKYDFKLYFLNSLIYTASTIILTLLLASMFAYCISRMKWRFNKAAMTYVILGMIIPVQVVIIPIFIILKELNLRNTYLGLVLPYTAFSLATSVLILYAFLRSLPAEMEESAYMDGCNIYNSFFRIIIPTIKPAISTLIVLIFMNIWNEFFMAYILIDKNTVRPLTIGLLNFFVGIGTMQWGLIGATMVVTSLPTILVYLFFSEKLENALTAGAILK